MEFKNLVENQTGKRIKILRTDNGSEYCNRSFLDYLRQCGVIHQTTAPYTPEKNGKAERMNRNIIEKVRCMIYDFGMDRKFWAEAVQTAAYIINRVPCRSLDKKTPQKRHGQILNLI